MNIIINGDCFDEIKKLEDNSIDLIITSPPYSDILRYGNQINTKKPDEYVNWILPLFNEIYRVLKPSGSFILNINDKVETNKRTRSYYIYELIYRSQKETDLKLYDTYIWYKKATVPNGSNKRFRNLTEFIFHFSKDPKQLKFYMDRVLEPLKDSSNDRLKYDIDKRIGTDDKGIKIIKKVKFNGNVRDGINGTTKNLVRPDNVFRFNTAGSSKINEIKHPATFNIELPSYFINLLTDEGDVVLDTFNGIGTTCLASKQMNRQYIGFELNETYYDYSLKLCAQTPIKNNNIKNGI